VLKMGLTRRSFVKDGLFGRLTPMCAPMFQTKARALLKILWMKLLKIRQESDILHTFMVCKIPLDANPNRIPRVL